MAFYVIIKQIRRRRPIAIKRIVTIPRGKIALLWLSSTCWISVQICDIAAADDDNKWIICVWTSILLHLDAACTAAACRQKAMWLRLEVNDSGVDKDDAVMTTIYRWQQVEIEAGTRTHAEAMKKMFSSILLGKCEPWELMPGPSW